MPDRDQLRAAIAEAAKPTEMVDAEDGQRSIRVRDTDEVTDAVMALVDPLLAELALQRRLIASARFCVDQLREALDG